MQNLRWFEVELSFQMCSYFIQGLSLMKVHLSNSRPVTLPFFGAIRVRRSSWGSAAIASGYVGIRHVGGHFAFEEPIPTSSSTHLCNAESNRVTAILRFTAKRFEMETTRNLQISQRTLTEDIDSQNPRYIAMGGNLCRSGTDIRGSQRGILD